MASIAWEMEQQRQRIIANAAITVPSRSDTTFRDVRRSIAVRIRVETRVWGPVSYTSCDSENCNWGDRRSA